MATSAHHKAVRDYLNANAGLSQTIIAGQLRVGMDDDIIACRPTGGETQHYHGGPGEISNQPTVQVIVRGHQSEYDATNQRARTIHDTLKNAEISGYSGLWMDEAVPLNPSVDGDDRHYFTVNITLLIDE